MTTQQPTVLYDKRGAVAHLTLNRPHRINAYDTAMRDDCSWRWRLCATTRTFAPPC